MATATPLPTTTLTLPHTLQARETPVESTTILSGGSGGPQVFTSTTNPIVLPEVVRSTYDLWMKPDYHLAQAQSVTLTAQNQSITLGSYLTGDGTNDNVVNINDFSLLSAAFGKSRNQTGYNEAVDFNDDDAVNIADNSLLAGNFGEAGAPDPRQPDQGMAFTPLAGTVAFDLGPDTQSVRAGRTLEITIQVRASGTPIEGAEAHLTFDPTLFQIDSITPGSRLPEIIQNRFDNVGGTLDYAAGTFSTPPNGTFTLARVRVRAMRAGTGVITFSRADAGSLGASVFGGSDQVVVAIR